MPWQQVDRYQSSQGRRDTIRSDNYVAMTEEADPDSLRAQVVTVANLAGKVVWKAKPAPAGTFLEHVWLTDDYLVAEALNIKKFTVELLAWELPSGKRVRVPSQAVPTQPEVAVSGGKVVFTTGDVDAGMCVRVWTLAAGEVSRVACEGPGEIVGDVAITEGAITNSTVVKPDKPGRCKTLHLVRDGNSQAFPGVTACVGWSAVATDGAVAWDEMDPSGEVLEEADGFASHGGTVAPLGGRID